MKILNRLLKPLFLSLLVLGLVHQTISPKAEKIADDKLPYLGLIAHMYENLEGEKPPFDLFLKGITGFSQYKTQGIFSDEPIISLIDFRLPSNEERFWIIDLAEGKVLYKTLVAHGRNSGNLMAEKFSNKPESYQSSLGFYRTLSPYIGKHGLSLRLEGLQQGLNDKAYERAIVLHGADYVSHQFAQQTGRLGRSLGCPAVPLHQTKEIIELIKDDHCLFIYYPNEQIEKVTQFETAKVAGFLSRIFG